LTAVYFTVGSNIDNIMNYDTVRFLNTAFAILFGIGVALVLFATVFPESPSQSLWLLRRQLRFRLSRFFVDSASTWSSFAYALCDQAASTLARVKDDSAAMRHWYAMTMIVLSTGYAADRLKRTLNAALPPRTKDEIESLLSRVSETFARPSRAGLTRRAWDARALRMGILKEARATNKIKELIALAEALVGCESLRVNLLKARLLSDEAHHVR
jgi:uncharacterized membrane protein YccC